MEYPTGEERERENHILEVKSSTETSTAGSRSTVLPEPKRRKVYATYATREGSKVRDYNQVAILLMDYVSGSVDAKSNQFDIMFVPTSDFPVFLQDSLAQDLTQKIQELTNNMTYAEKNDDDVFDEDSGLDDRDPTTEEIQHSEWCKLARTILNYETYRFQPLHDFTFAFPESTLFVSMNID